MEAELEYWVDRYSVWLEECGIQEICWDKTQRKYILNFQMVWGQQTSYQIHRKLSEIIRSMKLSRIQRIKWNFWYQKWDICLKK